MEDCIYYKTEGEFFRILLNRPDSLNALNLDMLISLDQALDAAEKSNSRFVTIESLDSRAFAAGADVKYFSGLSARALAEYVNMGKKTFNRLSELSKITFAVVDGYCLGGGFELALAADFILTTEKGKFGFPEATLGLIPGFSGIRRSIQRSGLHRTKLLISSGSILTATEALNYGLVDFIIENTEFDSVRSFVVQRFGRSAPSACAKLKDLLSAFSDREAIFLDYLESEAFVNLFESEETKEGLNAFIQKRKASFNISEDKQ